jgi:pimeloyl-ACP methyl ester carboxylesterase
MSIKYVTAETRRFMFAAFCLCLAAAQLAAIGKKDAPRPVRTDTVKGEDGWRSGFFMTDDHVKIHFEEYGEGSKTILGVHGYQGSGDSYKEAFELIKGDYHFVVYDERAHGRSDTPPNGYTMSRYAQDLRGLIKHLGLKNIIIAGYSMGMHIVWDYIRQYGDGDFDKIISTVMSPKIYNSGDYQLGIKGVDLEGAFAQMKQYNENYTAVVQGQIDAYKGFIESHKAYKVFYDYAVKNDPGAMTRLLIAMYGGDYWDVLPNITRPVLFVTAEKDLYPLASFERQKSLVKGESSIVVIPDYGHVFIMDVPDQYAEAIQQFVGPVQ